MIRKLYPRTTWRMDLRQLKPNTHRRRRRDETVESRRVGVGGVYMNSRRLPTDSAMQTNNALTQRYMGHDCRRVCSHRRHDVRNCRQLVANSCTHRRRDETRHAVSSRRRRRCVLGFKPRPSCMQFKDVHHCGFFTLNFDLDPSKVNTVYTVAMLNISATQTGKEQETTLLMCCLATKMTSHARVFSCNVLKK